MGSRGMRSCDMVSVSEQSRGDHGIQRGQNESNGGEVLQLTVSWDGTVGWNTRGMERNTRGMERNHRGMESPWDGIPVGWSRNRSVGWNRGMGSWHGSVIWDRGMGQWYGTVEGDHGMGP